MPLFPYAWGWSEPSYFRNKWVSLLFPYAWGWAEIMLYCGEEKVVVVPLCVGMSRVH